MPFSFRKSVKIAPGVRFNVSHRGAGLSAKVGGLRYSTRGSRSQGSGCLALLASPFVLIFNLYKLILLGIVAAAKAIWRAIRWMVAPLSDRRQIAGKIFAILGVVLLGILFISSGTAENSIASGLVLGLPFIALAGWTTYRIVSLVKG